MADIFREVDEEVRRDRALEIWQKYQIYIIAAVVIVIAATGGWRYYANQKQAAAEAAGARYEAALQLARDGKPDEADKAFQAIAADGPPGYAMLARFRNAADLSVSDKAKAVELYDTLAGDASIGPLLQDVARLRAAMLRIDDADEAEIRSRLEPMTQTAGVFRNSARELLGLAALKRDDTETAGKWLDAIVVDPQAPSDMQQRAEALLGLVTGAAPRKAPPAPSPVAPAPVDGAPAVPAAPGAAPPLPSAFQLGAPGFVPQTLPADSVAPSSPQPASPEPVAPPSTPAAPPAALPSTTRPETPPAASVPTPGTPPAASEAPAPASSTPPTPSAPPAR